MARVLKVSGPLDLAAIRAEAGVPTEFPADVLAEADRVATTSPLPDHDETDLPLVTIDPPGARDLDQAVHLTRTATGYRVSYAIADVGAFVPLGSAIDAEARRRGQTVYCPDGRTPLHPPQLSEGAASLLPGQLRPAALWTIDLDADGEVTTVDLRRARVRSRAQLDYESVGGQVPPELELLPEIGRLLQARARDRGAIELGMPSQEVEPAPDGSWAIAFRGQSDVEGWNAQISLLTGRCAARLMLDGGVGVLRTLPPADPGAVEALRRLAPGLGVAWPAGAGPGEVVASLDPARPRDAAFLDAAASLLRGAAYTAFDGPPPAQPGHGGVGSPYAHVTAPLRRLVDRFGTEVCLALAAGEQPAAGLRAALPELPALMAASDRRTHAVERAVVDLVEATVLAGRVGDVFDAVVLDADEKRSTVVLAELAVQARCDGRLTPGERVRVRLTAADPATRSVRFSPAGD
ncbi:RNB domain-containing ribonuclease [Modestobacter sp. VKM Ac-2986]|uniref:RNB domain-containing ribonuclease n=1 Tax=Modestobacter sp. VKM Ac-2986 TaxID=3004140 RepID=UPI0022ABC4B0|nr:RNB domain-containing ribonuclease [Modestobacter sp. VKM Ac-2986]MCZ2830642.1 RNB domain-containing ribonuclease [Modestobacter sp. VKM Ac-2986]